MSIRIMVAIAMVAGVSGCSSNSGLPQATSAIDTFHKTLNAGQFAAIYDASGSEMKAATSRDDMVKLLDAVHRKLGMFKSGNAQGWNDNYSTGGHFVAVSYAAHYDKGVANEAFTYRMGQGNAVLVGYNVNSTALIVN